MPAENDMKSLKLMKITYTSQNKLVNDRWQEMRYHHGVPLIAVAMTKNINNHGGGER